MSYPKKKKLENLDDSNRNLKRVSESTAEPCKRQRTDKVLEENLQAKKEKNLITACEFVSYKAYFDHKLRFQLIQLPSCAEHIICKHYDHKNGTSNKIMPPYAEESFKIEMKANMWREALEVCRLCVTPDQYLSANVLKDIVEIILNAHDDHHTDYSIDYLLDKCQQVLELNFSYHPPCMVKSLRKCYIDFLISPMDLRDKSCTNRKEFGCDKGVLKYCLNRLEHEISMDSKDEPLVDKYENIPEDMRQSVKGLHWQKEKFETYELLKRTERIKRLVAVLDSVIELLQSDLAIWHGRYTNNLGTYVTRSHKPLMADLLWSNNELLARAVNDNCKQILRLFIYMIHLQYPENQIKTMTLWLNTMIQTYYICKNNSNSDYPTSKYCNIFAHEFYKILSEMPHDSMIKVLKRIKPDYMQYLVGTQHIQKLLKTQEDNPIIILTEFVKKTQWKMFLESSSGIDEFLKPTCNVKNLIEHLEERCNCLITKLFDDKINSVTFSRFDPHFIPKDKEVSLNHVIYTLYITLKAYLDAYSVQNFQETLEKLNAKLQNNTPKNDLKLLPEFCTYTISETYITEYQSIYQSLKELILLLETMKKRGKLPNIFKIFENINLLRM